MAYELDDSSEILQGPGEWDIEVLESLLVDAHAEGIKPDELIMTTLCQREEDFDDNNPKWDESNKNYSFTELISLYEKLTKNTYAPKKRMWDGQGREFIADIPEDELKRRELYFQRFK